MTPRVPSPVKRRPLVLVTLAVLGLVVTGVYVVDRSRNGPPSVDGPVMSRRAHWGDDGSDDGFEGTVSITPTCVLVGTHAVVWPSGTSWDADGQAVRTEDGTEIVDGDQISSGVGSLPMPEDEFFADEGVRDALGGCEFDDLVVMNNESVTVEDGYEGTWTEAAQMPLSPRTSPQVGWTGREVLVVGGDTGVPTNPSAEGASTEEFVADGAAYDPDADKWRPIADAPEPIPYYYRSVMVGDVMVIQSLDDQGRASGWLAYDTSDDEWRRLPDPPQPVEDTGFLTAGAGRVGAMTQDGDVLELDLGTEAWAALPPSTLASRLRAARVTTTDVGTFVCGTVGGNDGQQPEYVVVDRWDGSDLDPLDGSHQVDCPHHWTGERLVNADIQTATGLDGNPPFGGRLDPATGEWSRLPHAPDVEDGLPDSITVNAARGRHVAGWGYVYDDVNGTWTPSGRPDSPVDRQTGATWTGPRLVVVGGLDEGAGYEDTSGLSDETWIWSPGG